MKPMNITVNGGPVQVPDRPTRSRKAPQRSQIEASTAVPAEVCWLRAEEARIKRLPDNEARHAQLVANRLQQRAAFERGARP